MNFDPPSFSTTSQSEPRFHTNPWQPKPRLPPPDAATNMYPAYYSPYVQRSLNSTYSGIRHPASAMMSPQGSMFNSNSGQVGDFYFQRVYDYDASTQTWTLNQKNHVIAGDQGSNQNHPKQLSTTSSTTPCSSNASATSAAAPKVNTSSFFVDPADSSISSDYSSSTSSGTDTGLAEVGMVHLPYDWSSTNVQSSDRDSLFALASVATSEHNTQSKEKATNSNSSFNSMNKPVNEACSGLEAMKIKLTTSQAYESTNQENCAASSKTETSISSAKEPHLTPLKTIEGEMLQVAQSNSELKAQQSNGISEPVKPHTATAISTTLASSFVSVVSTTTTSTQPNTLHYCRGHPASTLPRSQQSTGTNTSTASPITNDPPAKSTSNLNQQYAESFTMPKYYDSAILYPWMRENHKINETKTKTNANPPTSSTITFSRYPQPQPHSSQPPQNTNTNESSSKKIIQQNDEPLIDNQTPTHVRDIILRALAIESYIGPADYRSPTEFIEQFEMYAELLKLNASQKRVLFIRWAYQGNNLYMKAMKSTVNYEQAAKEFLNEMWAQKKIAYNPSSYSMRGPGGGSSSHGLLPPGGTSMYSSYMQPPFSFY